MARAAAVSDPIVEIEGLRQQIAEIQTQIKELANPRTLRPESESRDYIRQLIAQAAAQARPSPGALIVEHVSRLAAVPSFSVVSELGKIPAFAIVCCVAPELVERYLFEALDDVYADGRPVLSRDEQEEQLAHLKERLFSLELQEEQIICGLERAGRPSPSRRADASPAAVLHESTLSDEME